MNQNAAYLFNQGENVRAYDLLGSFPLSTSDVDGWEFRVWAPNARHVTVVGDFTDWIPNQVHLQPYGTTGIWVGEAQHAREAQCYKYAIEDASGNLHYKADPYARRQETRPGTASILYRTPDFEWNDASFFENLPGARESQALNIYEVHLASWRRDEHGNELNYRDLADQLAEHAVEMGFNAIEIMPVTEYPLDASWGYQVTGYFAPSGRYGKPEDFKYFVNHLHEAGIRVILDWVPAHFPKDAFGLYHFDGTPTYEYADPRLGEHAHWGTMVFDYSKAEVRSFLLSSAWYWIEEFHIDGLRVDAVSSMIYLDYGRDEFVTNRYGGNENLEATAFLKDLNRRVRDEFPQCILSAEESTAFPYLTKSVDDGGVGFTHKWNMGWMHDTLEYFSHDYPLRHLAHNSMTFSMTYAFAEQYILALSHDEVVHGKKSLIGRMPGDLWQQFASLRNLIGWQIGHPGAKLLFMGMEFAQFIEWRFAESLEWFLLDYEQHQKYKNYVRALNHLYLEEPALHELDDRWEGFQWQVVDDTKHEVYAFSRHGDDPRDCIVFVLNMIPQELKSYRLPVPYEGEYELLLNSDEHQWFGSDNWELNGYKPGLKTQTTLGELRKIYPDAISANIIEDKLRRTKHDLEQAIWTYYEAYVEGTENPFMQGQGSAQRGRLRSHFNTFLENVPMLIQKNNRPYLELNLPPLSTLVLKYRKEL